MFRVFMKKVPLIALVIFVLWLPYFIVCYPGTVSYDELWAIAQMFGSGSLSLTTGASYFSGHFAVDHKPILHTLILGGFVHFGDFIGSQNVGVFLLVLCQSAFAACVAAYAVTVIARKFPRGGIAALAFFALFPAIPLTLTCPTNDNLFVSFFLLWLLLSAELFGRLWKKEAGSSVSSTHKILWAIAGIGCILFKKIGIFIVVPTLVIALIFLRKSDKKLLLAGLGSLIAVQLVLSCVICPLADIIPGGRQESLGPALQMTARYLVDGYDSTEQEQETISKVVDIDRMVSTYTPTSQDYAKRSFRQTCSTAEILDYLGVWARQGLRHPDAYLQALWGVASGFIADFKPFDFLTNNSFGNIDNMLTTIMEQHADDSLVTDVSDLITLDSPSWALSAQKSLVDLANNLAATPLALLVALPLYAFWLPLIAVILILVFQRKRWIITIPVVLSMLVTLISPVIYFRYAFPLAFSLPFLLALGFPDALQQRPRHARAASEPK